MDTKTAAWVSSNTTGHCIVKGWSLPSDEDWIDTRLGCQQGRVKGMKKDNAPSRVGGLPSRGTTGDGSGEAAGRRREERSQREQGERSGGTAEAEHILVPICGRATWTLVGFQVTWPVRATGEQHRFEEKVNFNFFFRYT